MAKKETQSAFPFYFPATYENKEGFSAGMTLRDYFAGQVLAAFNLDPQEFYPISKLTEKCYQIADDMIEQRKIK